MPAVTSDSNSWKKGAQSPTLLPNEIHLWHAKLPIERDLYQKLKNSLSEDEISRLEKFHFEKDKERFLLTRIALKDILCRYANELRGKNFKFGYGPFGKPYLTELSNMSLEFNITHSGNDILFAISNSTPVGIDIEYFDTKTDLLSLAQEFCSEKEYHELQNLPGEALKLAFFRLWTRKEAFVKALGEGLYFPLKEVEVIKNGFIQAKTQTKALNEVAFESWKFEEIDLNPFSIATWVSKKNIINTQQWVWSL